VVIRVRIPYAVQIIAPASSILMGLFIKPLPYAAFV
jgi:hypothetical protein